MQVGGGKSHITVPVKLKAICLELSFISSDRDRKVNYNCMGKLVSRETCGRHLVRVGMGTTCGKHI